MREKKREHGHGSEYSNTPTPDRKSGARDRLKEVESERARLLSEEKTAVDEIGLITIKEPRQVIGGAKRERTSSSNGSASAPKKLQKTSGEKEADTSMFDTEAVEDLLRSEVLNNDTQVNHSANPDEIHVSLPVGHSRIYSQLGRSTSTVNDSDSESDANELDAFFGDTQGPKPTKQYSDFVEKLMAKHPEMKEIVNEFKKRPTAIQMAKQDLQRQREQAK
jgi:hypothetical protein